MNVQTHKASIRQGVLNMRLELDKNFVNAVSYEICRKVEKMSSFRKAETVLFYMPIKNEVSLLPLMRRVFKLKRVVLPIIYRNWKILMRAVDDLENLQEGRFGIYEPTNECEIVRSWDLDLVLMPGVAFGRDGSRIGFGKGCYDDLLKNMKCAKVGVAYDFQVFDKVPVEGHDVGVDAIVTEKEVLIPSSRPAGG